MKSRGIAAALLAALLATNSNAAPIGPDGAIANDPGLPVPGCSGAACLTAGFDDTADGDLSVGYSMAPVQGGNILIVSDDGAFSVRRGPGYSKYCSGQGVNTFPRAGCFERGESASVPEPGTLALLVAGLALILWGRPGLRPLRFRA